MGKRLSCIFCAGIIFLATPCLAAPTVLEEDHQFDAFYIAQAEEQVTTASHADMDDPLILQPVQITQENGADGMAAYIADRSGLGVEYGIRLSSLICKIAAEYGVDPILAASLFDQESRFRMDAISSAGAIGIAQLMPDTADRMGYDPYNLEDNIRGGIEYLNYQLQRFSSVGSLQASYAVAAYNAGPQAVVNYGDVPPYEETRNHVSAVARNYRYISSLL